MKPFLQGKKNLDVAPLRPTPAQLGSHDALRAPRRPEPSGDHRHSTAPSGANVEVIKEGDKVVRLIVTCTCGERVEVECLYPAG
jgi:hypothetical protein